MSCGGVLEAALGSAIALTAFVFVRRVAAPRAAFAALKAIVAIKRRIDAHKNRPKD